jgi:hypothetical protein
MSLTVGTGPFGEHDRSAPLLIWDPVPQRNADPQYDAERVRDMLCFFNERVDLELDGTVGDRPRTQYSREE